MALLSDLVAICAEHRLDSEATLSLFSRRLREAGRVSKAGRGRGAAKMTFLDGARFLIGCAATDHPERVADAESVFSSILLSSRTIRGNDTSDQRIGDRSTLDIGLATVLERIANGTIHAEQLRADEQRAERRQSRYVIRTPAHLTFDVFRSGVSAVIRAGNESLTYNHPAAIQMMDAKHGDTMLELSKAWERETERFRSGKNLHATLHAGLLIAVANAIAGTPDVNAERQSTVTEPGASAPGQIEDEA